MEDEEYYRMMRNQYSHRSEKKVNKDFQYTKWNNHQGREDAQMLLEKKKRTISNLMINFFYFTIS